MWECNFASEPADHKLFWLLFLRKVKWILAAALFGAVLGSGVYYLGNQVFAPPMEYQVSGEVYVDYEVVDGYGISLTCYNAETWNTMIQSDEFVDRILATVNEQGFFISKELVKESMFAELVSDSRLLITSVTMEDPDLAVAVSHGLLGAIITFGEEQDGVKEIRIMSDPQQAAFEEKENRIGSAALTGAVLLVFLSMVILLLNTAMDDSIYIPASFENRYHITSLETLSSPRLYADLSYLLKDLGKVAVLSLDEEIPIEKVVDKLFKVYETGAKSQQKPVFVPFRNVEEHPLLTEEIRKTDTCILVAGFAKHDGKRIERTISYLNRQDCKITGGLLWGADEKLLSRYYGHKSANQKGIKS
ncbi:MAG TPA: hypothetical protein VJY54_10370 [Lachnospiraceae bacterium]|nr:hypothetical protein [Lachnospiraceae bacterium]